ncbi:MAG TPA: GWxTD domain-containing protein [Gemmatimonadales bacterium]|nr:GWxTD domain-containing protein [Gemmatimonadales bacterium]
MIAALLGGMQAIPPQGTGDKVIGDLARFYRGGQTLVNGFVRVPHQLLSGVNGAGGLAIYAVEVRVTDQSGTLLTRDRWTRRVSWETRQVPGSQSLEPFAFALAPGDYSVQVTVEDSGSSTREAVDLPVEAYKSRPRASDLMLAYGIRPVTAGDSTPSASEVRKGNFLIATAPDVTLTPERSTLAYYCEVYRDTAGSVPAFVRVVGENGRVMVETQVARTQVGAGGGPIAASVDLAGLPPGAYRLELEIGDGEQTVEVSAAFRMAGFETAERLAQAESTTVREDRYTYATEAQLDSMAEPLGYIASPGELSVYRGLSYEGKQRFLRDFWRHHNATPDAEEAFYQRVRESNRRFREVGAARIPGWSTDRGRIFVKYGEPDEVRREPQTGPDNPWEAWKYTRTKPLKFVFLDKTRLGHYSLIYSDDVTERNPGDWQQELSSTAVQEIMAF